VPRDRLLRRDDRDRRHSFRVHPSSSLWKNSSPPPDSRWRRITQVTSSKVRKIHGLLGQPASRFLAFGAKRLRGVCFTSSRAAAQACFGRPNVVGVHQAEIRAVPQTGLREPPGQMAPVAVAGGNPPASSRSPVVQRVSLLRVHHLPPHPKHQRAPNQREKMYHATIKLRRGRIDRGGRVATNGKMRSLGQDVVPHGLAPPVGLAGPLPGPIARPSSTPRARTRTTSCGGASAPWRP
jgi:hypothetical protein